MFRYIPTWHSENVQHPYLNSTPVAFDAAISTGMPPSFVGVKLVTAGIPEVQVARAHAEPIVALVKYPFRWHMIISKQPYSFVDTKLLLTYGNSSSTYKGSRSYPLPAARAAVADLLPEYDCRMGPGIDADWHIARILTGSWAVVK